MKKESDLIMYLPEVKKKKILVLKNQTKDNLQKCMKIMELKCKVVNINMRGKEEKDEKDEKEDEGRKGFSKMRELMQKKKRKI